PPIGVIGGIPGVFFADIGGGSFHGQDYTFATNKAVSYNPIIDYQPDADGNPVPIYGREQTIDGLRLVDGRASYGLGLETFALGFPIHFDWSWRTLFNKDWEDALFASVGGSHEFRKARFAVWIGYDF